MKRLSFALVLLSVSSNLIASEFSDLWKSVYKNSLSNKSYSEKLKSIKIAKDNVSKHWLPRLYFDSSVYQTNDAAYSFMGNLNQRSIKQTDFVPNDLNNPDRKIYQTHTLGAYLPLYEGGSKVNEVKAKDYLYKATEAESKLAELALYSETVKLYGFYLVSSQSEKELLEVDKEVKNILKNYSLGNKNNPMGRSGLLGLQSLVYKIDAELDQLRVIKSSVLEALKELSQEKNLYLLTKNINLDLFLKENISSLIKSDREESYKVKSLNKMAEMTSSYKEASKAFNLPQVGIFAQNSYYAGDRDQAQSQMIGLSVKWEFFNLVNWGKSAEVEGQAHAAKAYALAIKQQEKIKSDSNQSKEKVIKKNIVRMNSALKNLKEQTKINYRLFKNGVINVLQMSQVLNSKLDLIKYIDQANNEHLKVWTDIYVVKGEIR